MRADEIKGKVPSKAISIAILGIFILVSSILPLFSFEGYSILGNTTSHLGARGSPNAWIMNVVFGVLAIRSVRIIYTVRAPYIRIFGTLFGLALFMTGVFRHAPLVEGIDFSGFQNAMHSVFASATGFSFFLLSLGYGIMCKGRQRVIAFAVASVSIIIPLGMMGFSQFAGLLQRLMFVTAFLWLFLNLNSENIKISDGELI